MSYRVLINSSSSIVQIGLSFCVKKSIVCSCITRTNSYEQIFEEESNLDINLFVFDVLQFKEMQYLCKKLASYFKDAKVVFLVDDLNIEGVLDFNEVTYIHINSSEKEVVKRLRELSKRLRPAYKYKSITKQIQSKYKFSERERECANLFMRGYTVSQISKVLSLKLNTVSTYKKRIHKKTNTTNLVQLIKMLYVLRT